MTKPWTYSVGEAAKALQVEVSELRRALRDGWFPGRFIQGGQIRIPRQEVEVAGDGWRRYAVLEPDIEESSSESSPPASAQFQALRSDLKQLLREERAALVEEVVRPLHDQLHRMASLETEVRGLKERVERLRLPAPVHGGIERLVEEIVQLEQALGHGDSSSES